MGAKIYIKGYKSRPSIWLFAAMALLVPFLIFLGNSQALRFFSAQCNMIHDSAFEYGYLLKYQIGTNNEYAFPDSDIILYKDEDGRFAIPVSCFMELSDSVYDDADLLKGADRCPLSETEIALAENVIKKNDLQVGEKIWAQFPDRSGLTELSIVAVMKEGYSLFDEGALGVGLGVLGHNERYLANISCDCVVFSHESKASYLANEPQALKSAFSARGVFLKALKQLVLLFVLYAAFLTVSVLLFGPIVKTSIEILGTMRRKGYERRKAQALLVLEALWSCLLPIIAGTVIGCAFFLQGIAEVGLLCGMCFVAAVCVVTVNAYRMKKYKVIR